MRGTGNQILSRSVRGYHRQRKVGWPTDHCLKTIRRSRSFRILPDTLTKPMFLLSNRTAKYCGTIGHGSLWDLAGVLKEVLVKVRQLVAAFVSLCAGAPPSYPRSGKVASGFHFHIEIHPPLRTPNLLKHLAGPEVGGGSFLSDTSPEQKAAGLGKGSTSRSLQTATAARNE